MLGLSKKTWVIGGVVAALAGSAALATQMRDRSPEKRIERMTDRVSDRLDLTEEQKQAFTKVTSSYVNMRGTTPEFMLGLSGQLKDLAADNTLTEDEVNQLRTEIKAEFDRRADVLIPEFVNFYNTLDTEQKDQVMARLDKMSERIGKGRKGKHHRKNRDKE